MAEDKPRLARLTAILTKLQSKRIVTAKDIAEKHHVSIRTVYRDIRTLEQSGIPIVTEEGKGYSIMEGYKLPPVMFTEEEANALITAGHLISKNKDQSLIHQYQNAITKIKSVLRLSQKSKTEFLAQRIQIRNNYSDEKTSNFLIQLHTYIADFQVVTIDYISLNGQHTTRKTEPFALYTTNNNWVLIAYCRMRNDFRAFRLDCIQHLSPTPVHFEPHKITLEQYFEECRKKCLHTPDIPMSQDQSYFDANHLNSRNMQKVRIEPFMLIGIATRTTNEGQKAEAEIAELWQRFMRKNILEKIPNKVDYAIYSVYTDYEGDHTKPYTAILGCKVDNLNEIPEGMVGKSFDGGSYVKTSAKGDLMNGLIINHWAKIWAMDLDRVFTADYEAFGEKAQNPSNAEVDFYVAVKE